MAEMMPELPPDSDEIPAGFLIPCCACNGRKRMGLHGAESYPDRERRLLASEARHGIETFSTDAKFARHCCNSMGGAGAYKGRPGECMHGFNIPEWQAWHTEKISNAFVCLREKDYRAIVSCKGTGCRYFLSVR